jgi:glycosyltransferase involved in cell wall biosynthesis
MVCNISDHTESGRGRLRGGLRNWLRRRVDLVTSNGPGCTRYLRSLGYPEARLLPYHYCHDAGKVFRGERRFSGPPHRLFYCGSLTPRKGILPLIEELAGWCRDHPARNVELTLAGRGPLDETIRTVPRPANLQLTMAGPLDASAIRDEYGRSDLMVFPTLADEWGLVVNESLASGTPVLGSSLSQAVEVLCRDGVNSWLFDPRCPGSARNALERAMSTPPAELKRMSDASRAAVAGIDVHSSGDEFSAIVDAALALRDDPNRTGRLTNTTLNHDTCCSSP